VPLTGNLRSWNDDRGFGFIAPTHGGPELFAHISAFPPDGSRPVAGESLTYELGRGKDGKPQAVRVVRQAIGQASGRTTGPTNGRTAGAAPAHAPRAAERPSWRPAERRPARRRSRRAVGLVVALLVGIGAFGYSKVQQRSSAPPQQAPAAPMAPAVLQPAASFRCDGRTHCSQMTSCSEARYFLANCPGVQMDGPGLTVIRDVGILPGKTTNARAFATEVVALVREVTGTESARLFRVKSCLLPQTSSCLCPRG
jgi:cold shock CspA family protein